MGNKYEVNKNLKDPIKISYLPIKELVLDDENPRFAGLAKNLSEKKLLEKLRREMHLDELIDSFIANGYYKNEPLLVIPSKKFKNKYVVIEGNRRLAALRIVTSGEFQISAQLKKELTTEIPVAIYPNRQMLWTFLGFRHINGPQIWDSYSKAVYALRIHREYKIPVNTIMTRIGDRSKTVIKMINGLRVLEQAEKSGFLKKEKIELDRFYFSHLYTILQFPKTRKFLGIKEKTADDLFQKNPIPRKLFPNLKILLLFLFGNEDGSIQPIIKSQNPDLRNLNNILGSKEAFNFLKDNYQEIGALEIALSYAGIPDYILEDLIYKTLNSLRKVKSMMYKYRENSEIYKSVKEIEEITFDIIKEMESKKGKK